MAKKKNDEETLAQEAGQSTISRYITFQHGFCGMKSLFGNILSYCFNSLPKFNIKGASTERLSRRPAKAMGSPRVGSNATDVVLWFKWLGKLFPWEANKETRNNMIHSFSAYA